MRPCSKRRSCRRRLRSRLRTDPRADLRPDIPGTKRGSHGDDRAAVPQRAPRSRSCDSGRGNQPGAAHALVRRPAQRRSNPRGDRHPGPAQHAGQGGRRRHHRPALLQQGRGDHRLPVRSVREILLLLRPPGTLRRRAERGRSRQEGPGHRLCRCFGQCPEKHATPALCGLPPHRRQTLVGGDAHRPLRYPRGLG